MFVSLSVESPSALDADKFMMLIGNLLLRCVKSVAFFHYLIIVAISRYKKKLNLIHPQDVA